MKIRLTATIQGVGHPGEVRSTTDPHEAPIIDAVYAATLIAAGLAEEVVDAA